MQCLMSDGKTPLISWLAGVIQLQTFILVIHTAYTHYGLKIPQQVSKHDIKNLTILLRSLSKLCRHARNSPNI